MKVAKFERVSVEQFIIDAAKCFPLPDIDNCLNDAWQSVQLPRRATAGSAGYDFMLPFDVVLEPGETALIPTGVRVKIDDGWMLAIFPRSGLGFKYRLQLDNTVGIIDSDYYEADNEGHIMAKITNDSRDGKTLTLNAGDRFAQGIFLQYGLAVDDEASASRNGGFGSTGL